MSKKVLYVGMDESNHGETKTEIGEIVVATFSYNKEYWDEAAKHPNRKNYSQVISALREGVDYVYTVLPHELASPHYSNLPLVASTLVGRILHLQYASEIKIGLDGQLSYADRRQMMEEFKDMGFEPKISNYMKKNGSHVGPKMIYLSHLIANDLFRNLLVLAENPHYLRFDALKFDKINA